MRRLRAEVMHVDEVLGYRRGLGMSKARDKPSTLPL
jgi:hypothetical protein